ncbi:MAG: (d)CMP kinase [Chloroflexi bacterium]|nr:(d)CMP kinase [Chloroflexota bacterium]
MVLAIDGPAGAGKSTVAELLANELGYFYFDTGALYRAVSVRCLEEGVDLSDETRLGQLVGEIDIQVRPASVEDGRQIDVLLHGRDISHAIRTPEVDAVVSRVAASPAVRAGLIDLQRRQVQGVGTILAGRDIGTVVCPDADLKIYLTASPAERAHRRLVQVGGAPDRLGEMEAAIVERDRKDASRAIAPMVKADDAVEIDSDGKSIEQVVRLIRELLTERVATPRAAEAGR